MEFKCKLCDGKKHELLHSGVRDRNDINVLRCIDCGLVFLTSIDMDITEMYEDSKMRTHVYNVIDDNYVNTSWERRLEITFENDKRRFQQFKDLCKEKSVLDFGCGAGGFLNHIREVTDKVYGVELEKKARVNLRTQGIQMAADIDEFKNEKFDVITMFHVMEHVNEPSILLKKVYNHLADDGIFICETPNANDVLLTLYNCKEFQDFTYWSAHVILYTSETLEKMIQKQGFIAEWNTQIQRYNLSNHLYWLANGKPGGHAKWKMFNEKILNDEYERILSPANKCQW